MTKQARLYAEAVSAGRAEMERVRQWYASPASHEFIFNAPSGKIEADARLRGHQAICVALRGLRVSKRAMRELVDRASAEAGCSDDVASVFAELERRERNLAGFRGLRASLAA